LIPLKSVAGATVGGEKQLVYGAVGRCIVVVYGVFGMDIVVVFVVLWNGVLLCSKLLLSEEAVL